MYTDFAKRPIYDNTLVGVSADFISPLDRRRLASKFSNALRQQVAVSDNYNISEPAALGARLFPNFYGGFKMCTIEFGPMPYNEAVTSLMSLMNAVEENGFTTNKCKMRMRIWHDATFANGSKMPHISLPKLIINLNEAETIKFWKNFNMERAWKCSLKYAYPKNVFMTDIGPHVFENATATSLKYPSSNFFGLNTDAVRKGYVEVRYVSGKNYQKNRVRIIDALNDIIEKTHAAMLPAPTTEREKAVMANAASEQNSAVKKMSTFESFSEAFPLIRLTADMRDATEILVTKYDEIRDKLFDIVTYCGVRSGRVNFDSTRGRLQLFECRVRDGFCVENIDFFKCDVNGDFAKCDFDECDIHGSALKESRLHNRNSVRNSALLSTSFIGVSNDLFRTYVDNPHGKPIEATLRECVVRNGIIDPKSDVDQNTEIIKTKRA